MSVCRASKVEIYRGKELVREMIMPSEQIPILQEAEKWIRHSRGENMPYTMTVRESQKVVDDVDVSAYRTFSYSKYNQKTAQMYLIVITTDIEQ